MAFHLKKKYNAGLGLVANDTAEFHSTVSELLGEYSTRILERMVLRTLAPGLPETEVGKTSFCQMIEEVKNGKTKISGDT